MGDAVTGSKKTCFVVMGFGKKTDYQTGRVLDLDKSYQYIIKPAAEEAGLDCKRADEIVHSGTIDVPMYEQLLTADVVVADVSTSNPNAFYELGVRHALRPYTTITIAEDKMTFPFDVNHLLIRKYRHLGEDIGFGEVLRMKTDLRNAIHTIAQQPVDDSPVYTFLQGLNPPMRKIAQVVAAQAAAGTPDDEQTGADIAGETISTLMREANTAMDDSDFITAKALLRRVRVMAPKHSYVAQRLALATYKSKLPSETAALEEARAILTELKPEISTDIETLGLWGALHKRMWDLSKDRPALDTAIFSYEKGFYLKNDYYNGINLAYMYNIRAAASKGDEAVADRVLAERTRARVQTICGSLLADQEVRSSAEKYWILATLAEAALGTNDPKGCERYLLEAKQMTPKPADWMVQSTEEQLARLRHLL